MQVLHIKKVHQIFEALSYNLETINIREKIELTELPFEKYRFCQIYSVHLKCSQFKMTSTDHPSTAHPSKSTGHHHWPKKQQQLSITADCVLMCSCRKRHTNTCPVVQADESWMPNEDIRNLNQLEREKKSEAKGQPSRNLSISKNLKLCFKMYHRPPILQFGCLAATLETSELVDKNPLKKMPLHLSTPIMNLTMENQNSLQASLQNLVDKS